MPGTSIQRDRTEPTWLSGPVALALHRRALQANGGAPGVRDPGLLESALARPQQRFAYDEGADLFTLASLYVTGVVRNHPFIDGNKRTGLSLGLVFLARNGLRFDANQFELADAVIAQAAGQSDEESFAAFLRANSMPVR